jgi:hypothetical protein
VPRFVEELIRQSNVFGIDAVIDRKESQIISESKGRRRDVQTGGSVQSDALPRPRTWRRKRWPDRLSRGAMVPSANYDALAVIE